MVEKVDTFTERTALLRTSVILLLKEAEDA